MGEQGEEEEQEERRCPRASTASARNKDEDAARFLDNLKAQHLACDRRCRPRFTGMSTRSEGSVDSIAKTSETSAPRLRKDNSTRNGDIDREDSDDGPGMIMITVDPRRLQTGQKKKAAA